jgi:putative phosphoesterase
MDAWGSGERQGLRRGRPAAATCTVGLISDTHGLLRPEAVAALADCDHIVHAGDIGDPAILDALARTAPLTVVRGNNDRALWATVLPASVRVEVGGVVIEIIHDLAEWTAVGAAEVRVLVCGHSHRPGIAWRGDLLIVNPGSAGPRRFSLPVSVGRLTIDAGIVTPHLLDLGLAPTGPLPGERR